MQIVAQHAAAKQSASKSSSGVVLLNMQIQCQSQHRHHALQIAVETNKKLGELAGLCKLDAEGSPAKVIGCSSACVTDYGEETEALRVLKGMMKQRNA
jgi:hypothetical protein